ncbi:LexA family protein [Clostridium sp. WILCCON 0269]|uniref:LexA family protein n=1 Tax=Candidatus Clostridium eludens TaxID=3381663 RepID=A0ABW8SHB5_9CLOT
MNSHCEDLLKLPAHWFNNSEEHFVLKVKGDSMLGADIDNGDLVIIRKQNAADNRDIVAVAVDTENATLKRFMKMGDTVLLIPENEKYEPIQIISHQVKILGIVVGVMKKCSFSKNEIVQ